MKRTIGQALVAFAVALLLARVASLQAADGPAEHPSTPGSGAKASDATTDGTVPDTPAPRNVEELKARLAKLRVRYAPFLQSRAAAAPPRLRRDLCGDDWRSHFEIKRVSDKPAAEIARRPDSPGWENAGLDVSAWEQTSVPEWRYDSLARKQPASCILWYRKTFAAQRPADGQRVFLVFEGVDWEAEVWLNGKRLGSHSVYFEPFRFDVTDVLAEQNTLAVRVIDGPQFGEPAAYWAVFPVPYAADQRYVRERARSLTGLRNGDTHNGSGYGIHREVYLETAAASVIANVLVRGYPARHEAVVQVETDVAGNRPAALKVDLLPENFEGASFSRTLPLAAESGEGRQTVTVPMPNAQRWSPESPYLYRCRVSLLDKAGRASDVRDAVFGHRSVELVSELRPRAGLQAGTLLLDGQPLHLRGTNIQGLNALWFWGERDKLLDSLLLLKAADFNAIRACQHVQFPEVRELLDRVGILSEQDVGSRFPQLGPQTRPALLAASAAIARECYNNPGVVLLSFANETSFDPTDMLRAALAVDPQRLFKPISGNGAKGGWSHARAGRDGYKLTDEHWAAVLDDFHPYWGWYGQVGKVAALCVPQAPDRLSTVGEYGSEAIDGYETMKHYPAEWGTLPAQDADTLWGQVQVTKDDVRQRVGLRGRKPSNLGEYIEASQNFQYDQLAELTKGWRCSPRRIAGYFQFHFIDVLPANWPKSIVSHDLTPKRGYFAMAQVNQPLVPLPRLIEGGQAMELWVANDLPQAHAGCRIQWSVLRAGRTVAHGKLAVKVPASDAVLAGTADLTAVPQDANVVDLHLTLESKEGRPLSHYVQEVYLDAWRARKAAFAFRAKTAAWIEAETAVGDDHPELKADSSKAESVSAGQSLAVHADQHASAAAEWTLKLDAALEKPELLIRHASTKSVAVRLSVGETVIGEATLAPTGGWGYKADEWAWIAIALPKPLAAGSVPIRLEFLNKMPLNLDCLALALAGTPRPPDVRNGTLNPPRR